MKNTKRIDKGIRASIIGALANIAIASGKLVAGLLSASTAITADAIQNYSDALTSIATAIGLKYASKAPDKQHPYGHGRMEYVAAFVVALIILAASVQFFVTSIKKIISPQSINFNYLIFVVVLVSASGKILLYIYYKIKNKVAKSPAIKAAALDAFGDIIIGFGAAGAYFFSRYTNFPLDGVCGLVISVIIGYNGIALIRETMADILGGTTNTEIGEKIIQLVAKDEHIIGSHDLMVHSYGIDKHIASIHIEVPCTLSLAEAHKIADSIERQVEKELHIELVVHIDPVHPVSDAIIDLQSRIQDVLENIDPSLTFHDLDWDCASKVLKFDVTLPYSLQARQAEIQQQIESAFTEDIKLVLRIDYS